MRRAASGAQRHAFDLHGAGTSRVQNALLDPPKLPTNIQSNLVEFLGTDFISGLTTIAGVSNK